MEYLSNKAPMLPALGLSKLFEKQTLKTNLKNQENNNEKNENVRNSISVFN